MVKAFSFRYEGRYVGHILVVSKQGIETDPEKTSRILNWLIPTTPEKVRKFLGFITRLLISGRRKHTLYCASQTKKYQFRQ